MNARDRVQFRIAQEAARVMIEDGVEDYGRAKLKAAERLGLRDVRQLPRNDVIDLARQEYHRLYRDASHECRLLSLRRIAVEIMAQLEAFSPCLVGDAVAGDAGPHSPVTIQVFPEAPEQVITKLLDARIPFRETSHQIAGRIGFVEVPGLRFFAGQSRVDIVILAPDGAGRHWVRRKSQLPKLSLAELRRLLEDQPGSSPDRNTRWTT
ncbi:hypothetical protein [Methylotetracoccus oryzae]|uniref:hypothetical protein n=1 Tax=Methylotetracoccus oryzae TaxID=1919059 RepID=UPI001118BDCF|nr:hypothetical protein [Methylotetracoccus oryzae]